MQNRPSPSPLPRRLLDDAWWLAGALVEPSPGAALPTAPAGPRTTDGGVPLAPGARRRAALLRGPRGLGLRGTGLVGPELALTALADWLFWQRGIGLSLPLFCAAVGLAAMRLRPGRRGGAGRLSAAPLLLAALAPALDRPTALSAAFAVVGTAVALGLGAPPGAAAWPSRLLGAARGLLGGPGRVLRDLARRRRLIECRRGARGGRLLRWLAWIVPAFLVAVFTALLSCADPLIADWLAAVPLPSLDDLLAVLPRALFWAVVVTKLWPVIRPRRRRPHAPRPAAPRSGARWFGRIAALLLSPAAVLRALVLLDALLALQIGLDGAYLWGGMALPDGMTYAAYAHRGAYPLLATALVAGALALAIRRPGAPRPSRPAAALLGLFLGETVILVASAMERLALYVAAYALTEWRAAAFAWMGLVAFGLASIAAAPALGQGPRGLLRANLLAALAVLYGWCFLDVPRLVADYDVARCAELKGEGPALDIRMLADLGPEAIPALDRYLVGFAPDDRRERAERDRARLAGEVRAGLADWRSWSFAGWRLARYLDTVEAAGQAGRTPDP